MVCTSPYSASVMVMLGMRPFPARIGKGYLADGRAVTGRNQRLMELADDAYAPDPCVRETFRSGTTKTDTRPSAHSRGPLPMNIAHTTIWVT